MTYINNEVYDINFCDKCDIAINCKFRPSRSMGARHSVMYIIPHPTASDYKNDLCTSRKNKIIKDFNDSFNFSAYYTSLVKCVSKEILFDHEIDNCFPYLKHELFLINPKVIVTIGDTVTKRFLEYTYFREVVDKPHVLNLNNVETIIYPIYHVAYKDKSEMITLYNNSFLNIAKLYKAFIDKNYFNIDLL